MDLSLTTMAAVVRVLHYRRAATTLSNSPIPPVDITPTRTVSCYRCNGAVNLRILADDMRFGMVFVYFFSDTIVRKYENLDSRTWSCETQRKCGLCNGSFVIVEGPMEKREEFRTNIYSWVHDLTLFLDYDLEGKTDMLPGRSFWIIHERNTDRFKTFFGRDANIRIKSGGRVELEKDIITGIYRMDLFHCICPVP